MQCCTARCLGVNVPLAVHSQRWLPARIWYTSIYMCSVANKQFATSPALPPQSASLLEAVSAAALRSRLKRYDTVETEIQCNFLELLGIVTAL